MPNKSGVDQFANLAIISVTESAANTLTFKKLETGISLSEKVAWVINRLEFTTTDWNATNFNGTGDYQDFGLTVSNSMASLQGTDPMVLDMERVLRQDLGTAASGMFMFTPLVKDFSMLPGGGIIVPPAPLYLALKGTGLAAATTITCRIFYTLLTLAVDQYWELVEARRVLAS